MSYNLPELPGGNASIESVIARAEEVQELLEKLGPAPDEAVDSKGNFLWGHTRVLIPEIVHAAVRALIAELIPIVPRDPSEWTGWSGASVDEKLAMIQEHVSRAWLPPFEGPYVHWIGELRAASERWIERPPGRKPSKDEGNMPAFIAFLQQFLSPQQREIRCGLVDDAGKAGTNPHGRTLDEIRDAIRFCREQDALADEEDGFEDELERAQPNPQLEG